MADEELQEKAFTIAHDANCLSENRLLEYALKKIEFRTAAADDAVMAIGVKDADATVLRALANKHPELLSATGDIHSLRFEALGELKADILEKKPKATDVHGGFEIAASKAPCVDL